MKIFTRILLVSVLLLINHSAKPEDGYRLWLRYDLITDKQILEEYNISITGFLIQGESPTFKTASSELHSGLNGLLGRSIPLIKSVKKSGAIVDSLTWFEGQIIGYRG
jgi:alpha-glucuronidase